MGESDTSTDEYDREGVPRGTQAGGESSEPREQVTREPSLLTELQKPASADWLKFTVATFLAIGVGYALTFFLASAFAPENAAVAGEFPSASFAFGVGLFLAPLIAAITGVRVGTGYRDRRNVVLANSFIGAAVGFLAMAVVLFVLVLSQAPAGQTDTSFGDLLAPLVGAAVGVGLTGALATYVVKAFE